jgi:hypothetical protein
MSKLLRDELVIEDAQTPQEDYSEHQNPGQFEPWYSTGTITTIVKEIESIDDGVSLLAFISPSPSFYMSLPSDIKSRSRLFDVIH